MHHAAGEGAEPISRSAGHLSGDTGRTEQGLRTPPPKPSSQPRPDVEQTLQRGFAELMCHLHASPCHGNGGGKLRDPCPALLVLLSPQSGGDGGVPSELSDKHHRDSPWRRRNVWERLVGRGEDGQQFRCALPSSGRSRVHGLRFYTPRPPRPMPGHETESASWSACFGVGSRDKLRGPQRKVISAPTMCL